jgi:Ca2+-binding RTX toxin-like protein
VISGEVRFHVGDDHYDGQSGAVGGTVSGASGDDVLLGGTEKEVFDGGDGKDMLSGGRGSDTLLGGTGSDQLIGGGGADTLVGGPGADLFRFDAGDSRFKTLDFISDFSHRAGDRIALDQIDADTTTREDDAFSLIGTAAFSGHAGELRFVSERGLTLIQGDCDGDGRADLVIKLAGENPLVAGDFIL